MLEGKSIRSVRTFAAIFVLCAAYYFARGQIFFNHPSLSAAALTASNKALLAAAVCFAIVSYSFRGDATRLQKAKRFCGWSWAFTFLVLLVDLWNANNGNLTLTMKKPDTEIWYVYESGHITTRGVLYELINPFSLMALAASSALPLVRHSDQVVSGKHIRSRR